MTWSQKTCFHLDPIEFLLHQMEDQHLRFLVQHGGQSREAVDPTQSLNLKKEARRRRDVACLWQKGGKTRDPMAIFRKQFKWRKMFLSNYPGWTLHTPAPKWNRRWVNSKEVWIHRPCAKSVLLEMGGLQKSVRKLNWLEISDFKWGTLRAWRWCRRLPSHLSQVPGNARSDHLSWQVLEHLSTISELKCILTLVTGQSFLLNQEYKKAILQGNVTWWHNLKKFLSRCPDGVENFFSTWQKERPLDGQS